MTKPRQAPTPANDSSCLSANSSAGPALFRLVRFWSRRWVTDASKGLAGETDRVRHVLTVEAVATQDDATVNAVAYQLGLDHSGASRMVREATRAGYLTRSPSEQDRRQASLRLTVQGRNLLEGSHRWQRQTFERLTASWTDYDRDMFAGYLERLAEELDLNY